MHKSVQEIVYASTLSHTKPDWTANSCISIQFDPTRVTWLVFVFITLPYNEWNKNKYVPHDRNITLMRAAFCNVICFTSECDIYA